MRLQNNVQVVSGSDVTIDISSLSPNEPVLCELAPGGQWSNEVQICFATPPKSCSNPPERYKNRVRFTDTSTLEIKDVRRDESGIYQCKTGFTQSRILISGIIVVGRLLLLIFKSILNEVFFHHINIYILVLPLSESLI